MKRIASKKIEIESRKLRLQRESLRTLTGEELDRAAGATGYCIVKSALPSLQNPSALCTVC